MKKKKKNKDNIKLLRHLILLFTSFATKSTGTDMAVLQSEYGPIIKMLDSFKLIELFEFKRRKFTGQIYVEVAPIYYLNLYTVYRAKKALAQARLFNIITERVGTMFEGLYTDNKRKFNFSAQLTTLTTIIRFVIVLSSVVLIASINSPESPFLITDLPYHIREVWRDFYFFYIFPTLSGLSDINLLFKEDRAQQLIANNRAALALDMWYILFQYWLVVLLRITLHPTLLRDHIQFSISKLTRYSTKPVYKHLAKAPESTAMVFFFIRTMLYYVNYFAYLESLYGLGRDPLIYGRPRFRTLKEIGWAIFL